jgi:hypothetical protein
MQRWLDGTLGSRKFVKIPEGFLQRAAGRELEYADDRLRRFATDLLRYLSLVLRSKEKLAKRLARM